MTGSARRRVQDDARELQLALLLNLERSGSRMGSDASDELGNRYELKTTTTTSVTTGRDIGPGYLSRLRRSYFICARGANTDLGFHINEVYFLSPAMMEQWIEIIALRLSADQTLVDSALDALRAASFQGTLSGCAKSATEGSPEPTRVPSSRTQ